MANETKKTNTITVNVESNETTTTEKKFSWVAFWVCLGLIAASLVGGIFWGKSMVKIIPQEPIYIKGDTVKVEIECPIPIKVIEPCDTLNIIKKCVKEGKYAEFFPERVKDSLIFIPTSEDSALIIKDWATERFYEETIFDTDTLGKATIKAKTQYNRLTLLESEMSPYIKEVPYIQEPKAVSPFVGLGVGTNSSIMVQGGLFVKDDWGGSVTYQYDFQNKKNIVGFMALYKF